MRKIGFWFLVAASSAAVWMAMPRAASAQYRYCQTLQSRSAYFSNRMVKYRARYVRCRQQGWGYGNCGEFRRRYKAFRHEYQMAWNNYTRWNCARYFQWHAPTWNTGNVHQCNQLASRVNHWRAVRNNYVAAWNRCRQYRGDLSPRCVRLRHKVNQWYANVRSARVQYRSWGCTFRWGRWNDPWATTPTPAPAPTPAPDPSDAPPDRCAALAARVQRWRGIRNNYIAAWNRCREGGGRCRRLRRKIHQWRARVRIARSQYRSWGCTFRWSRWQSPWQ